MGTPPTKEVTGEDELYEAAFDLVWGTTDDPVRVINAISRGYEALGRDEARKHPAMRALTIYLGFLHGGDEQPGSDAMMAIATYEAAKIQRVPSSSAA